MKKPLITLVLMVVAGFIVGWLTAPPLSAWFVAALDGFFRVPDSNSWLPVYLRFAFGVAGLFAAQVLALRLALTRTAFAPSVAVYLLIGIGGSISAAIVWHRLLIDFHRNVLLYASMLPLTPRDLPCLSIPFIGIVTSLVAALLYRWRSWLRRLFDGIFRPHSVLPHYDY